ncbi:MAG TPA: mandelate racemase/muconate lactonizing enzyme family protein [Chloroflexota bacterium]|nr:mandelate racemase/muconate lactonizing enzyme family protein [Chloroflexota bacterium]
MKIKEIRAALVDIAPPMTTKPRVERQLSEGFASPMQRYPDVKRSDWSARWKRAAVMVTAEDGTFGLGFTNHGAPVREIVNGHFAPLLTGQDCEATEKLWDMMRLASAPYGTAGLASYAISAVDIALWDLKGKLLRRPVYELLGGPQKESIPCYASNTDLSYGTENSIAWFLELGFKAVKLFLREGAQAGIGGIRRTEEIVAATREQIGPDVELMLDCWLSTNAEYFVRLAEALRPYRLKWLEDYFLGEDMESYLKVRGRLPGVTLASGEHWYTIHPFALAASRGLVDILQPDLAWVGGISAGVRICHLAEAHGLTVIAHAGMNYPWGQHLSLAMPAILMGERSEGVAPPGVPLEELTVLPGTATIRNGRVRPTDAPGLGMEIAREWLESKTV